MERPPWTIDGPRGALVLTTWDDDAPAAGVRLDALDAERALTRQLGSAGWSPVAPRALVHAARYVATRHLLRIGMRGDDPRALVVAALRRRVLVAWWVEQTYQSSRGSDGEEAEPEVFSASDEARKTWIEIELTDMEGNPVPGEPYWIKLPDGTVREGALDGAGRAYFGGLDPGSAEIRWPNRDGDATMTPPPMGQGAVRDPGGRSQVGDSRAGPRTWVEIELLDMEGNPVPHERYWIKLPDGSVREGTLDARGLAFFDDLDPGQCTIRWLGRDEEAAFLEADATTPGATDQVDAQVETLLSAARDGSPFCEECERARQAALAQRAN